MFSIIGIVLKHETFLTNIYIAMYARSSYLCVFLIMFISLKYVLCACIRTQKHLMFV